jgi:hypothetical protein
MTERTPTPWTIGGDDWKPWTGAISIIGADYVTVCWTTSGGNIPALANAVYIVKACNAFPDLVKALEDTLCELSHCATQLAARGLPGREGDSVSRALEAARRVLRDVKGAPDHG